MASNAEIERLLKHLQDAYPADFFQTMNETQAGIGAVLHLLFEAKSTMTAGQISERMGISTARVAVLLKKMDTKNLIIKEKDGSDARITVVRLSESGTKLAAELHDNIHQRIGQVIDKVGMERMLEFVAISREIKDMAAESHFDLPE